MRPPGIPADSGSNPELASEHFDTLALTRLLSANFDTTGETWKIPDEVVKAICQFDGLTTNGLVGKWVTSRKGGDEFSIEGKAEGTELGATVKVAVKARLFFNLGKRIVSLTWDQEDDRGQGPASPAAELKATVTVRRELLDTEPEELNAVALAKIPSGKIPDSLLQLHYTDPAGKYTFLAPRAWHATGQIGDHLVLRLVENGDWGLPVQATILSLKPSAGGKHMTAAEFKDAIAKQPGWEPTGVAADGELPTTPGRWLYRVSAGGKQDGLAVVQSFFCLGGANGEQVVVTVVAREDRAAKIGNRDVALVNTIEFLGKK